ncbi:MAG: TonB-dependent receptor [Candidatus Omnitrophica bacterium]|nr:TonB-dependent receptor [Candidatus Omnitrophota bacterium]
MVLCTSLVVCLSAPLFAVESRTVELPETETAVLNQLASALEQILEAPQAKPVLKPAPAAAGIIDRLVKFMPGRPPGTVGPSARPALEQTVPGRPPGTVGPSARPALEQTVPGRAVPVGVPQPIAPKPEAVETLPEQVTEQAAPAVPAMPAEEIPSYPAPEVIPKKYSLDRSILSSHRAPQKIRHVSENVKIVTAEELKKLPARDASEALHYIPGVDISIGSGFGHATAVSIQGSSSRHVLVMVDGIPFNQQSAGQANPAKIPIENVERIEIIKGAASGAWGSALGGVINFITKDVGTSAVPKISQTTSMAEHNAQKFSGEISGAAGPVGYYGFGSYMDSNGIRKYESVDELKMFGKISSKLTDALKITGSFGRSEAEIDGSTFGLNSIIPFDTFNRAPYMSAYGQTLLEWEPDDETHVESAFKFNDQFIRTDSYSVFGGADTFTSRSEFYDEYYGLALKAVLNFRDHDTLVTGYDFNWNLVQSTNLFKSRDIFYHSPYAFYTLNAGAVDAQFGGRYDWNSEYGYEFSPSYGGVLHIPGLPETLLRFNAAHAFNAPPLLWKYLEANVRGFAVNPDIKPEKAWVYEFGLETEPLPGVWFKVNFYRSDVTDAIAAARNAQGLQFRRNFQKFRRDGFEFESRVKLLESLTVSGSAAMNHVQDQMLDAEVRSNGIPLQSYRVMIDYEHSSGLGAVLLANYDRSDYVDVTFEPNDHKFIMDMKVYKKFRKVLRFADLNVFLNLYNLANYKYWSNQFAEAPRRYFEGGVSIEV